MREKLTGLFRRDATIHNEKKGPSMKNPGGGLATKKKHLAKALPNMVFVKSASELGDVSIIDALYFSGGKTDKDRDDRIAAYKNHEGFKILWTSDFEMLRWRPEHREQILDATDVIAGNSHYMANLLRGYFDSREVVHLTDPMDTNVIPGHKTREKIIYGCSQIILEKGVDEIISLYKQLENGKHAERELQRLFVGSSSTWGTEIRDLDSFNLEMKLEAVCTKFHWSLPNAKVQQIAANAWIFVSFARFETFGYAMIEALLGGCHVWAYPHLAYKDRIDAGVVHIADNALDARHHISIFIEEHELTHNDDGAQFVRDNYALDVFRKQFKDIVGTIYGI